MLKRTNLNRYRVRIRLYIRFRTAGTPFANRVRNHLLEAVTFATLLALISSAAALLLGGLAFVGAGRRGEEIEALHDRLDEEGKQWRHLLDVVSQRVDEAFERASQPNMPGEASLRLQGATEAIDDLRRDLREVQALVKREAEQRLATEISLFDALDDFRKSGHLGSQAPAAPKEASPPRRTRRSDSLFEIVDFGAPAGDREG